MKPDLDDVLVRLEKRHGRIALAPCRGVFESVLFENAAYLVDDAQRTATFKRLARQIGTTPGAILKVKKAELRAAIVDGGMLPAKRAEKLVAAANVAKRLGPKLEAIAKKPIAEARRALAKFPGFGGAAVDKLLMLWGGHRVLALDSNGLRVLARLGFGREAKSYDKTYREMQAAIAPEIPETAERLARAHALLRAHGQTTCTRTKPQCRDCPLSRECPSSTA